MPYAIVLTFDEISNHKITQVFKRFKEKQISTMFFVEKMKPHITLTVYDKIDVTIVKERLTLFIIETEQIRIQISSIGYFPSEESVLFLNPKESIELKTLQQKVLGYFKEFETKQNSTNWVPHCTLGNYIQKKNFAEAIDIIKEEIVMTEDNPFYITGEAISFVRFEQDPLKIDWWLDYKFKE